MTLLIATLIAFVGTVVTASAVSVVLDDWIWLVIYMTIVPVVIAVLAARRQGFAAYPGLAVATVVASAFAFALVEAASGYMELPGWYLFIATFPVSVVVGITSASFIGLARRALHSTPAPSI